MAPACFRRVYQRWFVHLSAKIRSMTGTKVILLVLAVALLANVVFVVYGSRELRKFKKEGTIVLATITRQETVDKEVWLHGNYWFKGKDYAVQYPQQRIHEPGDSLIFLYILPNDPLQWMPLDKYVVPSCLTPGDVPEGGWSQLPLQACADGMRRLR